ncbi:MAG: type II toxin-antitoxin system VapB family antitoxin [Caldimonas sp.]
MKTTLEIADPLLDEAKRIAARDGETLRSLVEQGLRKVVAERRSRSQRFKLADASVDGEGLQPPFRDAPWEQLRDLIYEGRGG